MDLVPLPSSDGGWHFVERSQIVAVKHIGPKKCSVIVTGGLILETNEDSHAIHRRIESSTSAKK